MSSHQISEMNIREAESELRNASLLPDLRYPLVKELMRCVENLVSTYIGENTLTSSESLLMILIKKDISDRKSAFDFYRRYPLKQVKFLELCANLIPNS